MTAATDAKVVLVTQDTRLEELIRRYNTYGQAQFYIEHHGGDFTDYRLEHETYKAAVDRAVSFLSGYCRLQVLNRSHVPNYLFGPRDVVVAVGRDGLVANVLKYLDGQPLIGVNPDPGRWDGVLLPFRAEDLPKILPETLRGTRPDQNVTLAQATLADGQTLCAVNDLFIGQRTHASARYLLRQGDRLEVQSSSGIIVSTGLGATGWFKSILAGAAAIAKYYNGSGFRVTGSFDRSTDGLYYTVREPYPSRSTGAEMVFGQIRRGQPLEIESHMPENGVIFSDGMEEDFLQFNSGTVAKIHVSQRKGRLIL